MAGEQPDNTRRPKPRQSVPWTPPDYEIADASAIQAVYAGNADAAQQKRAMDWILKRACGMGDWAFFPTGDRDTTLALGRQFVGHQILKLVQANIAALRRREPLGDMHEPKA